MEGVLLDTMFELPSLRGVEEIVISSEVIEGKARPLRIYSDRHEELGTSAWKRGRIRFPACWTGRIPRRMAGNSGCVCYKGSH